MIVITISALSGDSGTGNESVRRGRCPQEDTEALTTRTIRICRLCFVLSLAARFDEHRRDLLSTSVITGPPQDYTRCKMARSVTAPILAG